MIAPLPTTSDDRTSRIPHVPALDGLRGVAVAGVLLFHAGHLQGGFLGVDLFFTLSGFLITSLLLVEHDRDGRISLRRFWIRRARRLLPAMFVVVAAAVAVSPLVLSGREVDRLVDQALGTLFYVANWVEIAGSRDYWALFEAPTPLEHTWSLAIEEQFYLLWPLLVLGAIAAGGRRRGVWALLGVTLAGSVVASWVVVDGAAGVTRAYYGTDTRAASILVGAIVSVVTAGTTRRPTSSERTLHRVAAPALVLLVASWALVDGSELWLYRGGLLGHAVLTAVVIAAMAGPFHGRLAAGLGHPALVRLGVLSYGLYLWHWPVYVVLDETRTGIGGWALTAIRVLVAYALAAASYRWLEAPIRHQEWRLRRPVALTIGALGATTALVLAVGVLAGGEEAPPASAMAAQGNLSPGDEGPIRPRLLVIADGPASTAGEELVRTGDGLGLDVHVEVEGVCTLLPAGAPRCADRLQDWEDLIAGHRPDVVLLISRSLWAAHDPVGDAPLCGPSLQAQTDAELADVVGTLGSSGAEVVIATAPSAPGSEVTSGCTSEEIASMVAGAGARLIDLGRLDCVEPLCIPGTEATTPDPAALARWILDETARLTGVDGVPFVVLVGDSQAFSLVMQAPRAQDLGLHVGSLTELGCGLSTQPVVMDGEVLDMEQCRSSLDALLDRLEELDPAAVVVHAGAWESLDQVTTQGRVRYGEAAWEARLRGNVTAALERIGERHRLIALTTPCFAEGPGRDSYGTDELTERIAAYNEVLVEQTRRLGGEVVDLAAHLCPGSEPRHEIDGVVVRPDGIHAGEAGARALWPWLGEELRAAVRRG